MNANTIPSPIPPWHRPVESPIAQTLTANDDDGTISLNVAVTYLETDTLKAEPDDPYVVALPDGNYQQQTKRVYIPKAFEETTAPWRINGTFVGFTYLLMNNIGRAAILEWDGAGWQMVAGNAEPKD